MTALFVVLAFALGVVAAEAFAWFHRRRSARAQRSLVESRMAEFRALEADQKAARARAGRGESKRAFHASRHARRA